MYLCFITVSIQKKKLSTKCDEYDDDDVELLKPKMCLQEGVGGSLATQLSPDMITIEKSIDVSWIVE